MNALALAVSLGWSLIALGAADGPPPASTSKLLGVWENVDANASSMPKLVIASKDDKTSIRAWGKCHPQDCDWGEVPLELVTGNHGAWQPYALASWDQGFVERQAVVHLEGHQLVLEMFSIYRGDSGRPNSRSVIRFKLVQKEEQAAEPSRFRGEWKNADEKTRSTTRLVIAPESGHYTIHGWGKCSPNDCDWGAVPLALLTDIATDRQPYGLAIWDAGFAERHVVLHLERDQLVMESYRLYRDDSKRSNSRLVERFDAVQPEPTLAPSKETKK